MTNMSTRSKNKNAPEHQVEVPVVNSKPEDDDDDCVFWLKKIFHKLESIEQNQIDLRKEMEAKPRSIPSSIEFSGRSCNDLSQEKRTDDTILNINEKEFIQNNQEEWSKQLGNRKQAFYNSLRSKEIANIYEQFLNQKPPFIPRKFREKRYPGISDDQNKRITSLETNKLEIEIDRLREQHSKHDHLMYEAEKQIKEVISTSTLVEQRQKLNEIWLKSVQAEEKRSQEIWAKKRLFFSNMPVRESPISSYNEFTQSKPKQYNKTIRTTDRKSVV